MFVQFMNLLSMCCELSCFLFVIYLIVYIIRYIKEKLVKSSLLYKLEHDENNFYEIYQEIYDEKPLLRILFFLLPMVLSFILLYSYGNENTVIKYIIQSIGIGGIFYYLCILFLSMKNDKNNLKIIFLKRILNIQMNHEELFLFVKNNKKVWLSSLNIHLKKYNYVLLKGEMQLSKMEEIKQEQMIAEIKKLLKKLINMHIILKVKDENLEICKVSKDNILTINCLLTKIINGYQRNQVNNINFESFKEQLYKEVKIYEMFKYICEEIVSKYDN